MDTIDALIEILIYLVLLVFVFLPSIFAFKNTHPQRWLIFLVNVLLNSIGIGWIVGWVLYFSRQSTTEAGLDAQQPVPAEHSPLQPKINGTGHGMLSGFLKLIFVVAATAASTYSMFVFGAGMWSWIFLGVASLVLVSVFVSRLDPLSTVLGEVTGILSGIALALLLVAATTGGSFHMSESNVIFAYLLAFLSAFGFSAFFWENRTGKKSPDTPLKADDPDMPRP